MKMDDHKLSFKAALVIGLIILLLRLVILPSNILSYDVFGYYLYLPSLFIHQDLGLSNIEWLNQINLTYDAAPALYQIAPTESGNWIIRFNCGIAILVLPFFIIGHLVAGLTSYPADGFSAPYQWAVIASGIFYSLLGLVLTRKVLLEYFTDKVVALTLILLYVGSNLFFFVTMGNEIPHVYLYTLLMLLIWLTIKWHRKPVAYAALLIGLFAGLITITRTTGILALMFPVLWGIYNPASFGGKIKLLFRKFPHMILALVAFLMAILPQVIYWKMNTGHYYYNAYTDPQSGFDFFHPKFLDILFGFRKGFFIYSPIMVLAFIGIILSVRCCKESIFPVLLFTAANLYLIASYSTLVSYGWRAFIELHAPLALALGAVAARLTEFRKPWKLLIYSILGLLTLVNILKSYQTQMGVIDGSRMTRPYYFSAFFDLRPDEEHKKQLLVFRSEESTEYFNNPEDYIQRFTVTESFENPIPEHLKFYDTTLVTDGKYSRVLNKGFPWSAAIRLPYKDMTSMDHAWVRINADFYLPDARAAGKAYLVVDFKYQGKAYKYRAPSLIEIQSAIVAGEWFTINYDYLTPEVRTPDDPIEIYLWNDGDQDIYVDNLRATFFEKKPE
jgi:hypothetical protein